MAKTEGGQHLVRSHRGLREVGVGSAGSVLKVKGGAGRGIHSAVRSKGCRRKRCFLLGLKSRREAGESQALRGLWQCNQRAEAVCGINRGGRRHAESVGGDRVRTSSGQK